MRLPLVALLLTSFVVRAADRLPSDAPALVNVQSGVAVGAVVTEQGPSGVSQEVDLGPGDVCMNEAGAQKITKYLGLQSKQIAGLKAENQQLADAVNKAITDPPIRPGPVIAAAAGAAVVAAVVAVLVTVAVKK